MNTIIRTALFSFVVLTIVPVFAKRAWDPRCTCTFGMPQPERREVLQRYFVGDTFTITIPKETVCTDQDYIKNIVKESGIIECLTDLDALETSADFVSVTFKALKPGKVLVFTEICTQHADNPFGNRSTIINHYVNISLVTEGKQFNHYCCLPPAPNSK